MMRYFLIEPTGKPGPGLMVAKDFTEDCRQILDSHGWRRVPTAYAADVVIAPALRRKLDDSEMTAPRLGTLIFHPSALPHGRGPDAIRWALHREEPVSASTWFWAGGGLDTGPIAESEPVVLSLGESPLDNYARRFIPAARRALDRFARETPRRGIRMREQDEALATYDSFFKAPGDTSAVPSKGGEKPPKIENQPAGD